MQTGMKLGKPGPMRDRLVAAVLAGDKTATSALRAYYQDEGLQIPAAGDRAQLLDSADTPVATIEVTGARIMRMGDADMELAQAEGAGFASVAEYRSRHETFWANETIPNFKNTPAPTLDDDTEVVVVSFRVVDAD